MKKIWPWLLLLLLLILVCVWTKKDSIHLSSHSQISTAKTVPLITEDKHYIKYTITQRGTDYVLNGNFANTEQQNALGDITVAAGGTLTINNTSTNATLLGEEALALTNKILPHFIKNYQNGKIVYADNKLSIYGDVNSYESKHKMQRLLNASTLLSQDNTNVTVNKPIHFSITKHADNIAFKGLFNDETQINTLKSKLPNSTSLDVAQASHHVDKGAVVATEKILSLFMKKYKDGEITYKNEMLTVSGMVPTQKDLDTINTLLSQVGIPVINHTVIDQEALARAKAAEDAERARLEAQRKAQDNAKKLAQQKATEDAERTRLEAQRKAQDNAKKLAQQKAAEDAERARLEAQHNKEDERLKAIQIKERLAVKEKINQLLQIQNIEFEVGKSALTPKGKGTVDKLAKILAKYPNINIEIAGHTDSDGSAEFNQKLSQARVDTVKGRLIARTISARRLTAKGYGESQPLVPNTSDENKQRNRRVEFNIQGE